MKKLSLLILVILLLGGVYYLLNNQARKTNQITPQPTSVFPTTTTNSNSDKTAVSEITGNFYKTYDSCIKNPPAAAAGEISVYCQNNTGLTTTTFATNLERGGTVKAGADPIFCAQNVPENVDVIPDAQITGDKATVFVSEKLGSKQIKIQADFLKENGVWKIDNIICPLP